MYTARSLTNFAKRAKEMLAFACSIISIAYNAMPHNITDYQPYELMFGCIAPTIYDAWLGLAQYNDQASSNKCAWLNEQHELLMSTNR